MGFNALLVFNDWSLDFSKQVLYHLIQIASLNFNNELLPWLLIFPVGVTAIVSEKHAKIIALILIWPFIIATLIFGTIFIIGGIPIPNTTGGFPISRVISASVFGISIFSVWSSLKMIFVF